MINKHNNRQQRKQNPSGGKVEGTANCSSENTDSQEKRKKPRCQFKRCLSQIAFYRQICQQYAGNDDGNSSTGRSMSVILRPPLEQKIHKCLSGVFEQLPADRDIASVIKAKT